MAGNNIHIDLTEDIENDLKTKYGKLCADLSAPLGQMRQKLEKKCDDTHYEPMVNVVKSTIELFNVEIKKKATDAFEEWTNGNGSFKAAAIKSQSGSTAEQTAQQFENDIRDQFDEFWNNKPLGDENGLQVDTSRPKIQDSDFDDLKGIYTQYFGEIKQVGDDCKNEIANLGNDDPTYNVIIPAVTAITESIRAAFEAFSTKIDEAKQKSQDLKSAQNTENVNAQNTATTTSATADQVADSLKMFQDI